VAVIDASVYVAALNEGEAGHMASVEWLQQSVAEGLPISAPSILLPEVASAVSRGAASSRDLARRAVTDLQQDKVVDIVPVSVGLAARAADIAAAHGLRGCHAVYVALAQTLDQELVTLDRRQHDLAGLVVSVREP
jgi:predicted nucleic acid-binding protein